MQFVSEGKKYKDSDIPTIAKFCVEFVRRYESAVEIFREEMINILKFVGNRSEAAVSQIRRPLVLLYCEFLLCGIVAEEKTVGKMIRAFVETAVAFEVRFITSCSNHCVGRECCV